MEVPAAMYYTHHATTTAPAKGYVRWLGGRGKLAANAVETQHQTTVVVGMTRGALVSVRAMASATMGGASVPRLTV